MHLRLYFALELFIHGHGAAVVLVIENVQLGEASLEALGLGLAQAFSAPGRKATLGTLQHGIHLRSLYVFYLEDSVDEVFLV